MVIEILNGEYYGEWWLEVIRDAFEFGLVNHLVHVIGDLFPSKEISDTSEVIRVVNRGCGSWLS